ncbi:Unknown protein [Striga hermonthica]|uniref:Uncharacterized protein n=1 Tax=Striga hermonthica TaxID=68872 RepID=A0A9N7R2T6_STRHE|nr:Unknown protein [Striga hermonthica]
MGLVLSFKKISLLILLICAAIFHTSFAGSGSVASQEALSTTHHEEKQSSEAIRHDDEVSEIHERLLKVKTNDYGRYDPTPSMSKPPFKLIPN